MGGEQKASIFVRILPTVNFLHDYVRVNDDRKVIQVRQLQDLSLGHPERTKSAHERFWTFNTDGIFYNSSQSEVCSGVMQDVVRRVFDGCNATIIAYGQTGTGKSFTLSGLRNQYEHRGLIPRIMEELFKEANAMEIERETDVNITFLEVHNDQLKDLLSTSPKYVTMLTNRKATTYKGLTKYKIECLEDGLRLLFEGEKNRLMNRSNSYESSNRAHSIFTFYINCKSLVHSCSEVTTAKLHFIDLAGIDSVGLCSSAWKSHKDIGSANMTFSLLKDFLLLLRREKEHTAKRRSQLIRFLSDSLNTQSIVRFIGHISGDKENLAITISALRFGQLIQGLPCTLVPHTRIDWELEMLRLQNEVKHLKVELELFNIIVNHPEVSHAAMSQVELQQLQRLVAMYLQGQVSELEVLSCERAKLLLKIFRDMFNELDRDQPVELQPTVPSIVPEIGRVKKFTESVKITGRETVLKEQGLRQVGETDRKGIGIGPASKATKGPDGNITKALKGKKTTSKGVKNDKSTTSNNTEGSPPGQLSSPSGEPTLAPSRLIGESTTSMQTLESATAHDLPAVGSEGVPELPPHVPTKEEILNEFAAAEGKELHDATEKLTNEIEMLYRNFLAHSQFRSELQVSLNQIRCDLEQIQNQRHVVGDVYDKEGNVVVSTDEKEIALKFQEMQTKFDRASERCQKERSSLVEKQQELNASRKLFEERLLAYTTSKYASPAPIKEKKSAKIKLTLPGDAIRTKEENMEEFYKCLQRELQKAKKTKIK